MALRKALGQRLMAVSRTTLQAVAGRCRAVSGVHPARSVVSRSQPSVDHDPGDDGLFRRFLHKRALLSAELQSLPAGEGLREKLRVLDIAGSRIRFDGLIPPQTAAPMDGMPDITVEDVGKLLRVVQLEAVRSRLREIREIWMPFPEFVRVCGEACSDPGQGDELAKLLDESGNVVVLGKMVLLRPEMVNLPLSLSLSPSLIFNV